MKKLMVAFVAMAVAIVANAAAMNWSVDYSYQPGADTDEGPFAEGWMMAIFDAGNSATATSEMIVSLIQAGAADAVTKYAVSTGFGDGDGGYGTTNVSFVGDAGDEIGAYLVLFDASDVADASKFYVSDIATGTAPLSGVPGTIVFGEDGDLLDSAVAANWQSIGTSVPEPTSALMLLVGLAGLALKRKVA